MRRTSIVAIATLALAACASSSRGGDDTVGDDDAGDDDAVPPDGGDDVVPVRSCATRFSLRPEGLVEAVALAGEWDWEARTPLLDPDGDGLFEVELTLEAGVWAYKLVVTRPGGAVEWLLDPGNPYRAYDGGVENSGVRVDDCAAPRVRVTSHAIVGEGATVTRLAIERGAGGAPITDVHVALRHEGADTAAAFELEGGEVTVTLDGLAPGKYTLVAGAVDGAGAAADEVLVPFWIESEAFDWRDALVYMVMTDRFRNGDPSNDPGPTTGAEAAADFFGGDLAGITAAIEDGTFDALGVRALWLSPFVENATTVELENGHGVTAYHGYWPIKARAVDPRLGTEADLDAMVAAAHRHGIRVLMDYVINHVHQDHEYLATHPDWFRVGCECGKPGCDWTEHRLDCSFHPYMPDVDWQNRGASEQMIADALWWVERFDLDGLRVDAVKHVEDLAVTNLSTRVHETFEQGGTEYFLLGETAMGWNGDDLNANLPEYATIARYIGAFALSGQFDFVLYHATAYRVWADEARGMLHLDYWTRASLDQYPADAVMTPFVGSHDSERLVSLAQYGSASATVHHKWVSDGLPVEPGADLPYERATLALTWLMTVPGAPLLYYGDEYGEYGGADPDNRHMWAAPAERTAREAAMYAKVARAASLRQELAALRRGDYRPLTVTEDVLSFLRVSPLDAVAVVINRGAAQTVAIDIPTGTISDGTLVDRLDPAGRTVQLLDGHVTIPMAARSAAVLVRQ